MSSSPFVVPVGELLRHPGRSRPVGIETPVHWSVDLSTTVPEPPLRADLELMAVPGGIVVRGTVDIVMRSTCARCLAETEHVRRVDIDQIARPEGEALAEDAEPGYAVEGEALDLEPMLRDEVLLALPVVWRCEPECAGLGETAESDLNTDAPGRHAESPFAVLRDLLEPGE